MNTRHSTSLLLALSILLAWSCAKEIVKTQTPDLNYALMLDGATTSVTIPKAPSQRPAELTLEMMVLFDDVRARSSPLVAEANIDQWSGANGFTLKVEEGRVHWRLATATTTAHAFTPSFRPEPGRWYHFASTFDGQVARVFVDGSLIFEDQKKLSIHYGSKGFWIGRARNSYAGGNIFFKGQIDEVRLWDHARTADQISSSRKRTLQGNEPGLIGYWNFDGEVDEFDPAKDRSPSHNNGRVSGRVRLVRSSAFAH
jgi:hypothetical protein